MINLALLGRGISHSRSPEIYHDLFDGQVNYHLLDIDNAEEIESLETIFSKIDGLSITAPYKKHFLDQLTIDENIRKIGAVNCIKKYENQYIATNTDFLAAREVFTRERFETREVVILGNGAMANMFRVLLEELEVPYRLLNRKSDGNLNDLDYDQFSRDNLLIINCCSREFNFTASISSQSIFWDMNYSHKFHESSLSNQLTYIDGYELLYLQAKEAKKFWNFTL